MSNFKRKVSKLCFKITNQFLVAINLITNKYKYKVYVFGGCIGDYEIIDSLYEFDFTSIVESNFYNPKQPESMEEEK